MGKLTSVLIGNESLLVQCGEILLQSGGTIVQVVTSNPAIATWAAEKGLDARAWSDDLAAQLAPLHFDWLFSIANLRIIPDDVVQQAKRGAINFHDGPLPRFAGLNTPSWALLENQSQHGITWHVIAKGIDDGEILAQATFDINEDDTALTLNTRCFEAGITTFAQLVADIERDTLTPVPQDFGTRQYYGRHKRPEAAGTLDFTAPAAELSRLVRALSFGAGYANPLVTPKVAVGPAVFSLSNLEITTQPSQGQPGTVLGSAGNGILVSTADLVVRIEATGDADGTPLTAAVSPGTVLTMDAERRREITDVVASLVPAEGAHRQRLSAATELDLPDVKAGNGQPASYAALDINLPLHAGLTAGAVVTAFLARLSAQSDFTLGFASEAALALSARLPGYVSSTVPLRMTVPSAATLGALAESYATASERLRQQPAYLDDIFGRWPGLARPATTFALIETSQPAAQPVAGSAVSFVVHPDSGAVTLHFDSNRLSRDRAHTLLDRLTIFASAITELGTPLGALPVMSESEVRQILFERNDTASSYDHAATVHGLIERQVDKTPDAPAVAYLDRALTYRELDDQANRLAALLIERGVGPDTLVGLHLRRSIELVVGVLGIQKAGGAYVPLDPDFPADRIAFMVADSKAKIVVTDRAHLGSAAIAGVDAICMDDLAAASPAERPAPRAGAEHLAYVIYTSGSTGRPKGVMVEHRNVVNFFSGMDARVAQDAGDQNVWLAVTSLSFDISVLELFWTLARGFKVVLHASRTGGHNANRAADRRRKLNFGLFYWGNDDGAGPAKYRLLLEGAKFADNNGFDAIWTPERHFGAFGGPYPNPAVTGAAVASVTRNLSIRAGSCVLPLHHPARVAEEWAVVDNISNGRVALAFASGWMPEDFVLRPENAPPHNKTGMIRDIEIVRKLWRGEKVPFNFGAGTVDVMTQPRPVQKELPIWLTTAGNPETYREAARLGANVLTHLLGQSIEELAGKIKIYRDTLVEAGRNPADHKVTLMLHTLLGDDREAVREMAREPMKEYLRSATALIKQYAWAFPAFKKPAGLSQAMDIDLRSLDAAEMDGILEFAFQRYFEDSGLFGTVEDGVRRMDEIAAIGVDEVACLIDFGVPTDTVLEHLATLGQLVGQVKAPAEDHVAEPAGLAAEINRHRVTHLQCTPSMAAMFLMDGEDRQALGQVRHLFIGGEALQGALVKELRSATAATIENMYGPTETTIWSSTLTVSNTDGIVPIGQPIANTQLYVLDAEQRPVPPGVPGELYIGGDGVTRGYLGRPDLTETRFLPNPFAAGRMYRTGDLVAIGSEDGAVQFLGRADFQVKVRGYRIELGEIEARIGTFPGVKEVVVAARTDTANDVRLVAYLRIDGPRVDEAALRNHLGEALPAYMVPSHFVVLQSFPMTPNMKVDRNRLPKPEEAKQSVPAADYVAPSDDVQRGVAEAFRRALGLDKVGLFDNFFALGGHSLLAVQVHRELKANLAPDLAITDLFRFPSVAALAERITDRGKPDERLSAAAQRAAMRRSAMDRRAIPTRN